VQSGAGRTGKMWAIQHSGVEPDIICSAKGIASGMPLGVVISKAHVMDWVPGSHASTFGGNPVCIAAALATLDVLEREAIQNAATIGESMLKRMKAWESKYEVVGEVRGRGLMIGVEIVKDKKTKALAGKERDRIVDVLAFERGVLMLGCGETTVRLSPPLIITQDQADIAMDVLEECIAIVDKEVAAAGKTGSGAGKPTGA
jgi:4-aminobutyrate aminotransferase